MTPVNLILWSDDTKINLFTIRKTIPIVRWCNMVLQDHVVGMFFWNWAIIQYEGKIDADIISKKHSLQFNQTMTQNITNTGVDSEWPSQNPDLNPIWHV